MKEGREGGRQAGRKGGRKEGTGTCCSKTLVKFCFTPKQHKQGENGQNSQGLIANFKVLTYLEGSSLFMSFMWVGIIFVPLAASL